MIIVKSGNYAKIFSSKGVVRFHRPPPYSIIALITLYAAHGLQVMDMELQVLGDQQRH